MGSPLVTVFGGSGFVGRHVVRQLAKSGARIRVAVRRPNEGLFLKPMGDVGQIALVQANIRNDASIARAVAGADVVINLVGILSESGRQTFAGVHARGAERVAKAAADARVKTFIHLSAIGADIKSPSSYQSSKAKGEEAVRRHLPNAVILRPSVIFGPEDDFFNRFAALARISPFLPLIGGGHTRFQPVYVEDVASAVLRVTGHEETAGQTFELGGPDVASFRNILEKVMTVTGRRRLLVPLPFFIARIQGWFFQLLPNPVLTVDQVRMLEQDNIVSEGAQTLGDLGITPKSMDAVIPTYLYRFRKHGQFDGTGYVPDASNSGQNI